MDEKVKAKERAKRARVRRRKNFFKTILVIIAIAAVAFAAFAITMKICNPDYDFKNLIPQEKIQQVSVFIKEEIFKQTTTTAPAPTKPESTKPSVSKRQNYDYSSFDDFAFDTSLQGNQLGNLLNKSEGRVTYSSSYIYYSIASKGIYRFEPNSETNSAVLVKNYNLTCLNVLGDYVYFVDAETNRLKRVAVSGGDSLRICDDIRFAYLYKDKIYFIGTDNSVGCIGTDGFEKTVLYTAPADKQVSFAGISLSRVFVTQYDKVADYTEYITVSLDGKTKNYFRSDTKGDEIVNLQMEGGFFYYYEKQKDGSFHLIRQKFGSQKTVTLLEKCSLTDYPVIYANRLYYTDKKNSHINAMELNMNSMEKKTMLYTASADDTNTIGIGYGYQYVFLFGRAKETGRMRYRGSCIYTSSSPDNIIEFSKGRWSY